MINFKEFQKIDLKIATILDAEAVDGSEKLLKIQIDLGQEKRQLLAGIAQFYSCEDLIGKQIVIVANLEPRKMMGFESQGMLLATGDNPVLLIPDKQVNPGDKVS